jgi:hypothetical protein
VKLIHVTDPGRLNESQRARVHYQSLDGQTLMCGHGNVYREMEGEKYRIWHPTKRPVTCASCTKRIESLVRFQVAGLSAGQLEDLLAHIESFRVPPENGTPDSTE